MNISSTRINSNPSQQTSTRTSSSALPASPEAPGDAFTFSSKPERGDIGTILKRGLHWGAFAGVPAALGAGGAQIGEALGAESGSWIGSMAAGGVSQAYGLAHGGYAGWALTPGKKAGGIMLAMLTVPTGAVLGTLAATGLSIAGSAGGWPVAAGLAGTAFVAGAINGYLEPKLDN
ncbi:MAG: hypothetical protein WC314_21575 [Vulcanimicrobiota bacterium]